jgi:hypothetical protein
MRWEFFAASAAPWVVSWPASSGCCAACYRASAACCGDFSECPRCDRKRKPAHVSGGCRTRSRICARVPGRCPASVGGTDRCSRRVLLLYLLARCVARPFAIRPLPRARAAFPLTPAERLPVNLENASRIRPADLSTKPSALSRRLDFIACPSASCRETHPSCFPETISRTRIQPAPSA